MFPGIWLKNKQKYQNLKKQYFASWSHNVYVKGAKSYHIQQCKKIGKVVNLLHHYLVDPRHYSHNVVVELRHYYLC